MSSDPNIFDCLLDSKEMFELYQRIGTVLKSNMDIANEMGRDRASHNSLSLLLGTNIIQHCDEEYSKVKNYESSGPFYATLLESIKATYADEVTTIVNCNKHYDEARNQFYIFVNDIPLRYMGLAMLMEQAGQFERVKNREYFIGIRDYREEIKKKPQISLEELKKRLVRDAENGVKAEKYALQYEKARLMQLGISKDPLSISSIDVMAGYDMVSYESDQSENYDRFIEIKAVSRSGFFWSKNEYEVAKAKGERYYLYLVELSRIDDPGYVPDMIQNPATSIMEANDWFVEAQSYHIKRL